MIRREGRDSSRLVAGGPLWPSHRKGTLHTPYLVGSPEPVSGGSARPRRRSAWMPGTLSRLADQMFRAYRVCIWCAAAMFIVGCSSPAASRAPAADVLPTRTGCKLGTVTGRVTWPAGFETEFADPLMQVWLENTETGEATVLPLDPGRWSYSAQVAPGTYLVYAWLPGWRHIGMPEPVAEGSDHPVQPAVRVQAGNIEEAPQIERWETVEGSILALCGRVIDGTGTEPVADGVLVIRQ
jgi:hypothetical protein